MTDERDRAKTDFFNTTKDHKMVIALDHHLYRHVIFTKNESSIYRFDLITWPGHLSVCGDMGSWMFSRLPDMFEFFRSHPGELGINPGYWMEKLEAVDKHGKGAMEYSQEIFKQTIKEAYEEMIEDKERKTKGLWENIQEEVLTAETEEQAFAQATQFEYKGFRFSDFWECNLKDYTYHYLWILWAIAWGIREYDNKKVGNKTNEVVASTS